MAILKAIKIPGIEYDFGGGRVYVVPPLPLGALELHQDKLEALRGTLNPLDPQSIKTIIDVTHAAMLRNYADITREEVGDLVDVGNMLDVFEVVMDVAHVKRKAIDEEKKAKATPPAQQAAAPDSST